MASRMGEKSMAHRQHPRYACHSGNFSTRPGGCADARATNQIDDNDVAGKITLETATRVGKKACFFVLFVFFVLNNKKKHVYFKPNPDSNKWRKWPEHSPVQKLSTGALNQSKSAEDICRSTCLLTLSQPETSMLTDIYANQVFNGRKRASVCTMLHNFR